MLSTVPVVDSLLLHMLSFVLVGFKKAKWSKEKLYEEAFVFPDCTVG